MIHYPRKVGVRRRPSVIRSLDHARKIIRFHRGMSGEKPLLPRARDERISSVSDIVSDLYHYAARHGITWDEVEARVESGLAADWED